MALLIAASWSGCGKKGDPLPPDVVLPKAAYDLRVEKASGGVRVTWTLPEGERDLGRVVIQRSEFETLLDRCPDCPQDFRSLADLRENDPRLIRAGERTQAYLDRDVRAGRLYLYRVLVCTGSGACSDPSPPADMKY
jgi:hypothetical protein